jgi:hypothetical protein
MCSAFFTHLGRNEPFAELIGDWLENLVSSIAIFGVTPTPARSAPAKSLLPEDQCRNVRRAARVAPSGQAIGMSRLPRREER